MTVRCFAALLSVLCALCATSARADVDVAQGPLAGAPLGAHVDVLLDESGELSLDAVRSPEQAARFTRPATPDLRYGYRKSGALWVRFTVRNTSAGAAPWLLEVQYPHLDHVSLFVPSADGHRRRDTGDAQPFAQRDFPHANFVFRMDEPAGSVRTYYLRVATVGSLSVPLLGWTERAFLERAYLEWTILFGFYGAALAVVLYNAWLFALTGVREHGYFALAVLGAVAAQFCFAGHAFQFVFFDSPAMAERAVLVALALCLLCNALFIRCHTEDEHVPNLIRYAVRGGIAYSILLVVLILCLPYYPAAVLTAISMIALQLPGVGGALYLRRRARQFPRSFSRDWVDMLVLGWLMIFAGALINAFTVAGHLPRNGLTIWAAQIGSTLQFLLVSTGLSTRLKWYKTELARANEELATELVALDAAVQLADAEAERSRAAVRAKDEFVATMSHELRTPLNAIINVPPAILEQVVDVTCVTCGACASHFELEAGEACAVDSTCPECAGRGTLTPHFEARFVGDPATTVRHLGLIERSGRHLLYVVRGILSANPTPHRLLLQPEPIDPVALAREVLEEMSALARRSGVEVQLDAPGAALALHADPGRLRQVLINLLGNAIKFSDGKGTVTLGVAPHGDSCRFYVRDQGIGIAPEKQARIFESFEQSGERGGRKFQGTGLGLSIARALVRLHGGNIWVESEPGAGACFQFLVPIHVPRALRSDSARHAS